jgi:hypothetical protein
MTSLDLRTIEQLHSDLTEIPNLYAYLPQVITGITGKAGDHKAGSRVPLATLVVDLLDKRMKNAVEWNVPKGTPAQWLDPRGNNLDGFGVIPRLTLWLHMILDELDQLDVHPDIDEDGWHDTRTLCETLRTTASWIITQPWAAEFITEIHTIRHNLREAFGLTDPYVPTCLNSWCGAKLQPMHSGSWWRCPACEREQVIAEDLQALANTQHLPAEEVAQILEVAWSTVRFWRRERWIYPVDRTSAGVALYDLEAVRTVKDTPLAQRAKVAR